MRLIAVLGYSDRRLDHLHPVCAKRVLRAAEEAIPDDTVLFSGWARHSAARPEADLMARAWTAPARRVLLDRNARSTLGNALAVARAARGVEADEVVLVTSGWHGRRASVLARAALLGTRTRVTLATTSERATPGVRVRELASLALLPVLAAAAVCSR